MKKLRVLLSVILIIVFSLSTFSGFKLYSKAAPAQKIIWAISQEPEQMDPSINNYALSSSVLGNIFVGLYKTGADRKTVPALAASYAVDKTGLIYTFKLKPGLKWSDGKPLTASDFEYGWKRVLDPKVASPASSDLYVLKNGEAYNSGKAKAEDVGVKAVDATTLKVTLENPTPWILSYTAMATMSPIRKDAVEGSKLWTSSPETYITDGAFMMSQIKPKEKYILKKNPNYYDAKNVKLETLEIVFMNEPTAEFAAYVNNEIQVSNDVSNEGLSKYKDSKELLTSGRIGYQYFDINTSIKPFNDPRVRKAFAYSLNRDQLINNILQIPGKKALGYVPYGIPDPSKLNKNYRDSAGDMFKENIPLAKKLLAEAGYANGKGLPETTIIAKSTQTAKDTAQALQAMWKQNLGVEVKIRTIETKAYWDEVHKGNFNFATDGWTGDYLDPMTMLAIFTSKENITNNKWSNLQYDKLIEATKKELYPPKRYANFVSLEKILAKEMPVIPTYYYTDVYLCKPGVMNVIKDNGGHTIFEYSYIQ